MGRFPVLSETFIIRKVIALANRGHSVTVMSRQRGDNNILRQNEGWEKLRIEYLIPTGGPWSVSALVSVFFATFRYVMRCPRKAALVFKAALRQRLSFSNRIKFFLKYLPFVNKQDFEIVHAEFLNLGVSYSFIRNLLPGKVVVSCRGADLHLLHLKDEKEITRTINFLKDVDLIHCVSEEMVNSLVRFGIDKTRAFVNRPAVAYAKFNLSPRAASNSNLGIISVGRLEWKKGFDYLLKTYSLLVDRGYSFRAIIIGSGSLQAELQFSIDDMRLNGHVTLLGGRSPDEVLTLLAESDMLVLSSVEEGISNAVLEGMAAGKAVVTTRCGGMGEVIDHGVDGLLVPIRDPEAMASAIAQLLDDSQYRSTLGANAKKKIQDQFDLRRQATVFESRYQTLLKEV